MHLSTFFVLVSTVNTTGTVEPMEMTFWGKISEMVIFRGQMFGARMFGHLSGKQDNRRE